MRRPVDVPLVDDERLVADVQLRPLVAAGVHLDEHASVRQELPEHGLRKSGELLEAGQHEELVRARHVRAHEQLLPVRRERERHRLPHLE